MQVVNSIIWNNRAVSTSGPGASVGYGSAPLAEFAHSLIQHSGGSINWLASLGSDLGGNLDGDPRFVDPVPPSSTGREDGDFALTAESLALDAGDSTLLPFDTPDLDRDGDSSEAIPVDLRGLGRIAGQSVDLGAIEFVDLDLLDSDRDGISDRFELIATGDPLGLEPFSDTDGNGLTALAEFVHGYLPGSPLGGPVGALARSRIDETEYLTITYDVNDQALEFTRVAVERRTDLNDPDGWSEGETVVISRESVGGGLTRIVERSPVPLGSTPCEYLRLRHEPLPLQGE